RDGPGLAKGSLVREERLHFKGGRAQHKGLSEVQGHHNPLSSLSGLVEHEVQALRGLGGRLGG
ncbi:MAG: hypothetical protein ACKPKO_37750, partial [Candidatus Fonsibacter sp.]